MPTPATAPRFVSAALLALESTAQLWRARRSSREAERRRIGLGAVLVAAALTLAVPVAADARPGKPVFLCEPGARVVDRKGKEGTVVKVRRSDCTVKLDDGTEGFYLAWMLKPAGGAKPAAAKAKVLERGTYRCSAAGGVAGTLRLTITSEARYADRHGTQGVYAYDPKTSRIVFQSGPWKGQFGKRLGRGKIGVSSREGGFFGTTCDRGK